MNYYSVFYWISVADGVKRFFGTSSTIFCFFTVVLFLCALVCVFGKNVTISEGNLSTKEEEDKDPDFRSWDGFQKQSLRWFYVSLILCLITWTAWVFVPSKKDCLLIVAGGAVGNFLTTDSSSKQLPADITRFLHSELQKDIASVNDDAKKELGIKAKTPKQTLLEKAQSMTKDELVKYIDSTNLIKDSE